MKSSPFLIISPASVYTKNSLSSAYAASVNSSLRSPSNLALAPHMVDVECTSLSVINLELPILLDSSAQLRFVKSVSHTSLLACLLACLRYSMRMSGR
jgi:hypothetical protein